MSDKIKLFLAAFSILIVIALKFIGIFYPEARLWGINQLSYFSIQFSILYLAVIIILIFLLSYAHKLKTVDSLINSFLRIADNIPRYIWYILISAVLIIIFYIFNDSAHLLGDSSLRLKELGVHGFARLKDTAAGEPLEFLIRDISYKYIFKPLGFDVLDSFRFWSYSCGLVYFWVAWLIARRLKLPKMNSSILFAYLIGWGGLMIFFGYIEYYSIAAAAIMLFFYFAITYFYTGKKLILLAAVFIIGYYLHNLTIFLLPSLCYLLLIEYRKNRQKPTIVLITTLTLIAVWAVNTFSYKQSGAFLLPYSNTEPGYLLWSKDHIVDILNELFLICPVFLILIPIQKFRNSGDCKHNQIALFSRLSAIAGIIALLLIDPQLNMARDWDLFALPLIGLHFALFIGVDWSKQNRIIKSSLVVIPIALTFLWVLLNSDEARSVSRFKDIIKLDESRSRYGYELLSTYYYQKKQWYQAEQACYQSLRRQPHFRSYLFLAYSQMKQGNQIGAEINLKKALELKPGNIEAIRNLGQLYFIIGKYDKAKHYFDIYRKTPRFRNDPEMIEMVNKLDRIINSKNSEGD
ncbi:MAG: hypothetical protein J7K40_10480 [candidate division Zixibacteria bacterium]|nr:hypothetical protein [candidate division Zixibacteria bacterium]